MCAVTDLTSGVGFLKFETLLDWIFLGLSLSSEVALCFRNLIAAWSLLHDPCCCPSMHLAELDLNHAGHNLCIHLATHGLQCLGFAP